MTTQNWPEFLSLIHKRMDSVGAGIPKVMGGFQGLAEAATGDGALNQKTKELIALAIGIAVRCDGCLAYHANAAAEQGATRAEILETIGVAVYMGGGPSVIYGSEALEAFDALS